MVMISFLLVVFFEHVFKLLFLKIILDFFVFLFLR